ncbi:Transcriptional repressor p66 alpha [Microtus ochrogaster]|uniref:Transcriptional repressor p66 alpha n=1 Tax=Microtus ochrogaster TaxID=79684 RepID=A0A8J6GV18_MICOH|nr:Transcriptional repressor p66 alpha [Microtus ochrogaster]
MVAGGVCGSGDHRSFIGADEAVPLVVTDAALRAPLQVHSGDIKSEKRPPSPDVIVLSDSEQPSSPRVNGLTTASLKDTSTEALLKSSPEERERMIKQLKEELRLEEAKLVLLKKLRQSQIQKEAIAQKPAASSGTSVTTPPPLVRGTQNIPAGKTSLQVSVYLSACFRIPPLLMTRFLSSLGL